MEQYSEIERQKGSIGKVPHKDKLQIAWLKVSYATIGSRSSALVVTNPPAILAGGFFVLHGGNDVMASLAQ
jgi:hypothetical protein